MDLGSDSPQRNLFRENQTNLFVGIPDSEGYNAIAFPIKMGTTWEVCMDPENCTNYRIEDLLDSYKTPAGKFEHVVVIKSDQGSLTYYAKNSGSLF